METSKINKFSQILEKVSAKSWVKSTQGAKTKDGAVKYKYLNLADIIEQLQPIVFECGCHLHCSVYTREDSKDTVVSIACVDDETNINIAYSCATVPQCADAQAFGSWLTYMRRYLICTMFNIVADDDDGAATLPKKILPQGNYAKAVEAVVSGKFTLKEVWDKYPDTPMHIRAEVADMVGKARQKEVTPQPASSAMPKAGTAATAPKSFSDGLFTDVIGNVEVQY